jgi:methanogenic corrinoid protein MtbC1
VAQAIRWLQQNAALAGRSATADVSALVHAFLESVARFDEAAADQVLADAFAQLPPDRAVVEVIRPILLEMGERWAHGDLSVGVEHFASYLIRRRLLALLAAQPPLGSLPAAVLACVPGEQHEFGLLMLALFLRWAGMRVIYLGADVPLADLVRCVRETRPTAVCLSVVYSPLARNLADTVAGLRAAGLSVPVFVGGAAAGEASLPGDAVLLREELAAAALAIVSRAGAVSGVRGRSGGSHGRRPRPDSQGGTMRPNTGEVS